MDGNGTAQWADYTRGFYRYEWDANSHAYTLQWKRGLPSEEELEQRYLPFYIGPPFYFVESYDQKQYRIDLMQRRHRLKLRRDRRKREKVVKMLTELKIPSSLTETVIKRIPALPVGAHLSDTLLMRIIRQCDTTRKITLSLHQSVDVAGGSKHLAITTSPGVLVDANTNMSSSPKGVDDVDSTDGIADRIKIAWETGLLLHCPGCIHVLGQGIADKIFAQSHVECSPSRVGGTLLYLPSDTTPPGDNPTATAALGDSKEVLNRMFGPFENKGALLGKETIDKNRLTCHHSSSVYDTLILSDGSNCMSLIMWKIVPCCKAFWISWLATNARCQGQGCGSLVMESIKALAKGLGMENLYLEVGVPSEMDDEQDRDLWAHAQEFYNRKNFSTATNKTIPENIDALRMHGEDTQYEVLVCVID